jgi:hypothetical protein
MANKKDKLQKAETEPTSREQANDEKQEPKKATKARRPSKKEELDDDEIEQISPEQAKQEMMAAIRKLRESQKS